MSQSLMSGEWLLLHFEKGSGSISVLLPDAKG